MAHPDVIVREAEPADREAWDRLASSQAESTSADRWAWLEATSRTYAQRAIRLVAEREGALIGTLGLLYCRHPIFGNYFATAPYHSYGGILAADRGTREILSRRAVDLGIENRIGHVLLRHVYEQPLAEEKWVDAPLYQTFQLDLTPGPDALWTALRGKFRNQVRTSMKHPLSLQFGHRDLIPDFYAAICRAMHELGSPAHSQSLYENLRNHFDADVEFVIIRHPEHGIIGGALLLYNGSKADLLQAFFGKAWRSMCPGNFLYWKLIEHCLSKGLSVFDMGRSLIGSNNQSFKMQMKPTLRQLNYQYRLIADQQIPTINQSNPRLQLGINAWKAAPAWLVDPLGPLLVRGLL